MKQSISEAFKKLAPDLRRPYDEASAKSKAEVVAKQTAMKAAKVPGPVPAYILFYKSKHKEIRAANPDVSITGMAKLVGGQWRGLSEAEKQVYRAEAATLRQALAA